MAIDETSADAPEMHKTNIVHKTLDAIKYPVSVASGLVWAHRHARNEVYDGLKDADAELRLARDAHKGNLAAESGKSTFKTIVYGEDRRFREKVTARLKANGFERPWHLVEGLGIHQRVDTLLKFLGAASITLGVIMTVANNKTLMDTFATQDRSRDTATRS